MDRERSRKHLTHVRGRMYPGGCVRVCADKQKSVKYSIRPPIEPPRSLAVESERGRAGLLRALRELRGREFVFSRLIDFTTSLPSEKNCVRFIAETFPQLSSGG